MRILAPSGICEPIVRYQFTVVSRARLPRKSQQEPFSMGLLGEAFFDASAICLSRSGMLPKRARIAPWQARISQTGPAFSLCKAA